MGMTLDDIDFDKVTAIEMLCKCGHFNVITVMNNNCEMCGLKLIEQIGGSSKE